MGGAMILATQSAERAGLGWLYTVAAGGIAGIAAYLLAARLGSGSAKSTVSYPRCLGRPAPFDHHGLGAILRFCQKTQWAKLATVGCHSERRCP